MGTFIPNTKEEQLQMLNDIGYKDWDDLFKDIPAAARIKGELNIRAGNCSNYGENGKPQRGI